MLQLHLYTHKYKMKRVIHLISLLLFSSLSLAGQIGSLDFKYYNQNAGFNFIKITGLYMDSKNYLWICSEAGLCKFDGVKFDYYYSSNQLDIDLSGDFTFSPIEDIQNNLWIGTQNGMSYYNRKLNSFIQIHIAKRKKISKKSNYYTRPFYIDHEGWVWLYTNGEILKYHPKNSSINFIFRNSNGMNYSPQKFYEELETFASNETKGFHIHNMRDGKIDSSIFIERFDNSLIDVYHFSFVADSMLWLSTNLGLLSYDILSGKFSRYDQMNGKTVKITHHAIWGDSMIFVSTYGQGVLLFDTRHKKFVKQWLHQADNEFSIHSNTVNQCYITRNNLLVLGYKNQGMGIASLTPTVIKNTNAWNQVYEKADERNIVGISSISDQELLLTNSQNELILFDLIKNKPSFIKKIVNPIPSIDHYHSELSLPNGTILMYHEGMFISVHKKTKKI